MRLLKLVPLFLIWSGFAAGAAGQNPIPENLQEVINKILSFTRMEKEIPEGGENRKFKELLREVAAKSGPDIDLWANRYEGEDINAKVIGMANDYSRRSEVYTSIESKYFHKREPIPNDSQSGFTPYPKNDLVTEEYRLVWETLFFASPSGTEFPDTMTMASETLGRIGNEKSVVVLDVLFRNAVSSPLGVGLGNAVCLGLCMLPSQSSLETLLNYLPLVEKQFKGRNISDRWTEIGPFFRTKASLIPDPERFYSDMEFKKRIEAWKMVVRKYPIADLDDERIGVLSDIRLILEGQWSLYGKPND